MKPFKKSMPVVVFLLSGAMTLGAAWTTKRLTNNTGSDRPSVASGGSNVYVVWCNDMSGNWEIYFRKSTDGGATWQSARRLTNTTEESYVPRIAVSGANVYVVWEDKTPGNSEIFFKKSADYGATWQTAKRLTNNAGESKYPAIAVNSTNVYVVWQDDTPGNNEIYLRKSADGGTTWQTAKKLTNNTGESKYPAIAVNSSNVYAVWQDDAPGNNTIYFRKSTDGGATWQTARKLTDNSGDSQAPKIVVRNANINIVWHDETPGNSAIYFRKSTDGGATWPTAKRLTNAATGDSGKPSFAVYTSNVFVVYGESYLGNVEIYFKKSTDGGATWPTTQRLTNYEHESYYPDIALGGGKIYVVWTDDTSGRWEIYLKYSPL